MKSAAAVLNFSTARSVRSNPTQQFLSRTILFFRLLSVWTRTTDSGVAGRNDRVLDSGFYAHPDLTTPINRILAYHSIFAADGDLTSLETNDVASWHGMIDLCCGHGKRRPRGRFFYRGIASESNVVLVKIGRTGRISEEQIQKGLQWVLDHARRTQDSRG